MKDTTDTATCRSASYLNYISKEDRLRMKLYNKRDVFNYPIVNFQFIIATFQYISPLIGYSIACGSYFNFLDRGLLLTRKLLNQGFLVIKLKSSLDRELLLTRKLLNQGFLVIKLKSSLDRELLLTRKLLN